MSWRVLLFGAAVIAILYGAADVVFSSGGPQHSPSSSESNPRRTAQWPSDQTEPSAGGVILKGATITEAPR